MIFQSLNGKNRETEEFGRQIGKSEHLLDLEFNLIFGLSYASLV